MKKNILLVGASLVSGNKGVNALTRGAILGLLDNQEALNIKILSYTAKERVVHSFEYNGNEISIEEIPLKNKFATMLNPILLITNKIKLNFLVKKVPVFNEIYSNIDWADLVLDISEGDSFSDIYGWKRYVLHANIKLLSIYMKKDLVLLPQTMGPYNNKVFKKITRYICNNAKRSYARDMISYKILTNQLNVKEDKVKYCSDLAFYMKPKENKEAIELRGKVGSDTLVGINISGLLYNGGYSQNNMFGFKSDYSDTMNQITEMFLESYSNVQIVFIPHVIVEDYPVEDDLVVCREMHKNYTSKYPGRVHSWENNLREDEIKGILKNCDFFIGGRMHSCIGAISSGVPTSPIAYSRKFIGIWEQFALESFVADPRKQTTKEILDTVKSSFEKRELVKEKIKSTNKRFNNELIDLFSSL
jgi:colanic acid/amylovoran biosynthesis protein